MLHKKPDTSAEIRPSHWPARELVAVGALLLFGTVLRCYHPSRMAVEHFDEGVYASNVWSPSPDHSYPARELYAPPLFPALVECSVLLFGTQPPIPMLVNLIAGSLTILVVWLLGRSWFGPVAGVTAAALCAFSDVHLVYSRTALTDPLLCLWLVLAMLCIGAGHRRMNVRLLMLGGAITGLAWWTKYNGWLPLAIQASGLTAWLIFGGAQARRDLWWHVRGALVTTVTAAAVIAPMFATIEGGYAAVAANHSGYLVTAGLDSSGLSWWRDLLSGWRESLQNQWGAHRLFDGALAVFGVAYALLLTAALCVGKRDGQTAWVGLRGNGPSPGNSFVLGWVGMLALAALACGVGTWASTSTAFAGMTLLVLAGGAVRGPASNQSSGDKRGSGEELSRGALPFWFLAAWFVGLFLATPMYRAYPRLTLPWLVAAWLGAGACCEWLLGALQRIRTGESAGETKRPYRIAVVLSLLSLVAGVALLFHNGDRLRPLRAEGRVAGWRIAGWDNRGAIRGVAAEITKRCERDIRGQASGIPGAGDGMTQFVVYVYGEPGLYYQLSARAQKSKPAFVVSPVQDLSLKPTKLPTFLVTGPHAYRSETFNQGWKKHRSRFRKIGSDIPYPASDLVLLNEMPASELLKRRLVFWVRVYRVR